MDQEIERFDVITASGERFTVVAYQELTPHRPLNGPTQWIAGMKRLELEDGSQVNFIDPENVRIVLTDEIARRVY